MRFAAPEGGRLAATVVRLMLGLQRTRIEHLQGASTATLVRVVREDLAAGRIECCRQPAIDAADLKAAATAAIAS
jgi:hypothetical protein